MDVLIEDVEEFLRKLSGGFALHAVQHTPMGRV
jgi:hypothetical protein